MRGGDWRRARRGPNVAVKTAVSASTRAATSRALVRPSRNDSLAAALTRVAAAPKSATRGDRVNAIEDSMAVAISGGRPAIAS